jgi:DNA repair exonuclease SbcCD ATPase subunit
VKLTHLHLDGFGRFGNLEIAFDPAMTVVYGPNEAGKSTLAAAVVALLYGVGRKEDRDAWRPWNGARYSGRLAYELADGRGFEVERNFERDSKAVRVRDRNGNDVSAEASLGKVVAPGAVHLGIPLDVFVNATCVRQGFVAIDGARAEAIGTSLAHALDGGPREDAALGALATLDRALATHVGTKRATVNAPLRRLEAQVRDERARAATLRGQLRALDDLRAARERTAVAAAKLGERRSEHQRRTRNVRAYDLRERIERLRRMRGEIAALTQDRAAYDDVADFPAQRVAELQTLFARAQTGDALAVETERALLDARLTPAQLSELEERLADGGALGDEAFASLQATAAQGEEARVRANLAMAQATAARRDVEGGASLLGAAAATAVLLALATIALTVERAWPAMLATGLVVLACASFVVTRLQHRRRAAVRVRSVQADGDAAAAIEVACTLEVARTLERLHVPSLNELARRRLRATELRVRRQAASDAQARARTARANALAAAAAFDALATRLAGSAGTRDQRVATARERGERSVAREGLALQLQMLQVARGDVLGDDDEIELERELAALVAEGAVPTRQDDGLSSRAFAAEGDDLERRERAALRETDRLGATLAQAERQIGDLAALDEGVALAEIEIARLTAFERAILLARERIEERTREAHERFARRLEDYAAATFERITNGRYAEVRVDPTTLRVRVRAPETGTICEIERLSAGTREQAYLLVRLAMARMFAEGAERLPLLLDDPFAFWDADRIGRGLPVLQAAAADSQLVVFTASAGLAEAAAQQGARRIDLDPAPEPARLLRP